MKKTTPTYTFNVKDMSLEERG